MVRPRWTAQAARDVLEVGARSLGLIYERLELLRFGTNAVYRLHPDPLIVRISRPGADPQAIEREWDLCTWLSGLHYPVPSPALEVMQRPLAVYDSVLSVWRYIPPPAPGPDGRAPEPTLEQMAALLRGLHGLSRPCPVELPAFDPLALIGARLRALAGAGQITRADAEVLWRWHGWLAPRFARAIAESRLGRGLIHGDAHRGNLILGSRGEPYLLDWDYAAIGPREWDLIPEALGPRRFGRPAAEYMAFAHAYGHDVTAWPHFQTAALVRELLITVWRFEVEAISPVRTESRLRMRYWRREPQPPPWSAF